MKYQKGLTLVELLIAMLIGLGLLWGSLSIMTTNNASLKLNEAIASVQENGRFALAKMTTLLRETGYYDPQAPELDKVGINLEQELADITENAVVFPGAYLSAASLGSQNGASGAPDTLVIAMAASSDCTWHEHGYGTISVAGETMEQTFHVVNEIFLEGDELKCIGYEGRGLRGDKAPSVSIKATLVENVEDFQVLYGVAVAGAGNVVTGQPETYMTADRASAAVTAGAVVVSIRIALLLYSDDVVAGPINQRVVKPLDKAAYTPTKRRIYRMFEQTVQLRNLWNSVVYGGDS